VQSIIAFISDFGLSDTWVGVCHAVIHSACPQAHVVDLAHDIAPFDVRKAAAVAASGVYQLPEVIHLVVVDPGVGGGRRDLCIETANGAMLVGPDNGVLIPAAWRAGGVLRVYAIEATKIDYQGPLATFHARDILAPAAAALACGVRPESLGNEVDASTLAESPFGPCSVDGDFVVGEVLECDRFGSLRFNIPAEELDRLGLNTERLEITLGHNSLVVPLRKTYADVTHGEPVALVDSSGWLTLSLNQGDAADRYGVAAGAHVRVRPLP
jgi:S-adenosyl-L-methionine hydrolase (adenosine-forming)